MTLQKQDVIFIDPPWGGKNYKENNKMIINIDIEQHGTVTQCLFYYIMIRLPTMTAPL